MEQTITFRVRESDKETIRNCASLMGLEMAAYCRMIILQSIRAYQENEVVVNDIK